MTLARSARTLRFSPLGGASTSAGGLRLRSGRIMKSSGKNPGLLGVREMPVRGTAEVELEALPLIETDDRTLAEGEGDELGEDETDEFMDAETF